LHPDVREVSVAALDDDYDDAHDHPLCTFWLGGHCLGLDVTLVGEVVTLTGTTPVPMSQPAVRGIFNLRGAPVVVLDLHQVLELEDDRDPTRATLGLLIRSGDIVAAGQIDRMDSVVPAGRGEFMPREAAGDHPAVLGFLDDREQGGHVITVIDPDVLVQRLKALRYLHDAAD
jgi:chemotaxis signal transduction protein